MDSEVTKDVESLVVVREAAEEAECCLGVCGAGILGHIGQGVCAREGGAREVLCSASSATSSRSGKGSVRFKGGQTGATYRRRSTGVFILVSFLKGRRVRTASISFTVYSDVRLLKADNINSKITRVFFSKEREN